MQCASTLFRVSTPYAPHTCLHQRRQLQVGKVVGVRRGDVQQQHLGDAGVAAAPVASSCAEQHADGRCVVLLAQVPAVWTRGRWEKVWGSAKRVKQPQNLLAHQLQPPDALLLQRSHTLWQNLLGF